VNYKTFGSPNNKRVGRTQKVLAQDKISSTKIAMQVAHAQKNNGYSSVESVG